jgi:adenine-specific DNA methylase
MCVRLANDKQGSRRWRLPNQRDEKARQVASSRLQKFDASPGQETLLIPTESIPQERVWKNNPVRVHLYGITKWRDIFTQRQLVSLGCFSRLVRHLADLDLGDLDRGLSEATQVCLALAVDRLADKCASLVVWNIPGEKVEHVFGRQALPMIWDFADANPLSDVGWEGACEWIVKVISETARAQLPVGHVECGSATKHPLPNNSAQALVTDPPYYDAVPYSTLANFFYVWLKRTVPESVRHLFHNELGPQAEECVVDEVRGKTRSYYEAMMTAALTEARRVVDPTGIGLAVFAHKSTEGWEAMLKAIVDAGWIVTGSWPIDTEMGTRLRARDSAVLASSVHLVCRPRGNPDDSIATDQVGEWRDVQAELPRRIQEWMPRLAEEGVVGADAIFACIGPALEIFSRYLRVEKASGEAVKLNEYLEQVWAAVAKEALTMIFSGADATGFEEDTRLTAMWLWTLKTGDLVSGEALSTEDESGEEEGDKNRGSGGFVLEFDAARKIAQGLGAHLEALQTVVAVEGKTARLLPVSDRTAHLFGKAQSEAPVGSRKKIRQLKLAFEEELVQAESAGDWGEKGTPKIGLTTLDRVHQSMILFASGRSEALRRFVVEDAVGRESRYWTLAQALSALYPSGSDEKRWVDGVLARKKGLGF